jgi:hypothetical protein
MGALLRIGNVETRGSGTTYTVCDEHGERFGFLHEYDDGRWGIRVLLTVQTLEARQEALDRMRRALETYRAGPGGPGDLSGRA